MSEVTSTTHKMVDYKEYDEKALMNAMIHDGFDPRLARTLLVCETCKNPFMHMLFVKSAQTEYGRRRSDETTELFQND